MKPSVNCGSDGLVYVCQCGFYAQCSTLQALHMVLVHGDGDVGLREDIYPAQCMQCFYTDLVPYTLVVASNGQLVEAARLGSTLMVLPQGYRDEGNHNDKR